MASSRDGCAAVYGVMATSRGPARRQATALRRRAATRTRARRRGRRSASRSRTTTTRRGFVTFVLRQANPGRWPRFSPPRNRRQGDSVLRALIGVRDDRSMSPWALALPATTRLTAPARAASEGEPRREQKRVSSRQSLHAGQSRVSPGVVLLRRAHRRTRAQSSQFGRLTMFLIFTTGITTLSGDLAAAGAGGR
jgi:hypothetical protein